MSALTITIKILPFLLGLFSLLLKYYFDKKLIKPWFITLLIGIVFSILAYLNHEETWAIILFSIFFIISVAIYFNENKMQNLYVKFVDFYKFIVSRFLSPDNEKVNEVLAKFQNHNGFLGKLDADYSREYEKWKKTHHNQNARPIVFLKIKPKPKLSWVAALDFNLLRELKYIGFKPVVFVYDIPVDFVSETNPRPTSEDELNKNKAKAIKNVKKLVGFGAEVCFSSDFFCKSKHSRYLHNLMLGSLISEFIEVYLKNEIPNETSYSDSQEIRLRLLGYLALVAAEVLIEKNPTWVVQWANRSEKWTKSSIITKPPLILTRTIKVRDRHIDQNTCIQISDTIKETKSKLSLYDSEKAKDELSEFCSLIGEQNINKINWQNSLANLDYQKIKDVVKEMYENEFISFEKNHEVELIMREDLTHNELKVKIENDEALKIAYLKLKAIELLTTFKDQYNI